MQIEIKHGPAYAMAVCGLDEGESLRAESGAMVSQSSSVSMKTGLGMGGSGGILKKLGRSLMSSNSFFTNVFTAGPGGGQVSLAPSNVGDVAKHDLDGKIFINSTCYLGGHPDIQPTIETTHFKRWFIGNSYLFMLQASGQGPILLNSFGAIHCLDITEPFIVDTGHIVAFEDSLDFELVRMGGSWFSAFFSGEGWVCRFQGSGKLWLQTRNAVGFGRMIGPKLPKRQEK